MRKVVVQYETDNGQKNVTSVLIVENDRQIDRFVSKQVGRDDFEYFVLVDKEMVGAFCVGTTYIMKD